MISLGVTIPRRAIAFASSPSNPSLTNLPRLTVCSRVSGGAGVGDATAGIAAIALANRRGTRYRILSMKISRAGRADVRRAGHQQDAALSRQVGPARREDQPSR